MLRDPDLKMMFSTSINYYVRSVILSYFRYSQLDLNVDKIQVTIQSNREWRELNVREII